MASRWRSRRRMEPWNSERMEVCYWHADFVLYDRGQLVDCVHASVLTKVCDVYHLMHRARLVKPFTCTCDLPSKPPPMVRHFTPRCATQCDTARHGATPRERCPFQARGKSHERSPFKKSFGRREILHFNFPLCRRMKERNER